MLRTIRLLLALLAICLVSLSSEQLFAQRRLLSKDGGNVTLANLGKEVSGEVLVRFRSGLKPSIKTAVHAAIGARTVRSFHIVRGS